MSYFTYVNGTIIVEPMGRTQSEKRYVIDTVLEHLPIVTGSERNMNVHVIQKNGYNHFSPFDEFGEITNNLVDEYGHKSRNRGYCNIQDNYILVVDGKLRDRKFSQTFREFIKWVCRLGKRIRIEDILVEVKGYDKSTIIRNTNMNGKNNSYDMVFGGLFEEPTWHNNNKDGELNWCEYLMWDKAKNSDYPMLLEYKYFADKENDREVKRRQTYNDKYSKD